ncbi:putative bifunctional diguanylate cyclase/phosphodiesterase [Dyella choica]|uniref:GGDEF domain-containing response regulator n=1 Tax=Dyella choica TaxID=1927959 RepID=A0A3S0PIL3_9GAMM|nr:EAL domain-containing protein [Dyella choica]RUL75428.1 GGDEF domain-containing response regulator [Dyella choica]
MSLDARILIVDDDENSRFMLRKRLKQLGFQHVTEASDGDAGLEQARRLPPDIMLLDVMMPGIDGVAVLRIMRDDEHLRGISVLMISAHDTLTMAAQCIELGADDYLAKPVLMPLLRARITALLERRRLRNVEHAFLSRFDAQTGLPNRAALLERIECTMSSGRPLALVAVACNNHANIALGADEGQAAALLSELASHVRSCWEQVDTIARVAENMLGWLIPTAQADQQLVLEVQAVLGMTAHASMHGLTASIATWPVEGAAAEATELLRLAMNEASRIDPLGEERVTLADPALRTRTRAALAIHEQLEDGLGRGELELYYQPIFAVRDGTRPVGAEALLRWNHPQRGVLAPGEFLEAVEHTPLMNRIDAWVMEQAIASLVAWHRHLPATFRLHVNVTARSLASGRLMEILSTHLSEPVRQHLALELTERLYVSDMPACVSVLHSLRALGIHVALDDFGTGFSSLSHVSLLPCDTMKIDRSFVSGVYANEQMRRLLKSMVSMAQSLGLMVIVEGVERDDELAVLRELGCPFVQGYLLGAPRPERDFLQRLH